MQWPTLKILPILWTLIFLSAIHSHGQISGFRLKQADSLFRAKRYVQSLEHYQAIFQQRQYTPAMLLKMAYIQEGLNQTGEALYALNLYYDLTGDKAALDKMEELAAKFKLEGYAQTDESRLLSIYHDFHWTIGMVLMALCVFMVSLAFFMKRRNRKPAAALAVLAVLLAALVLHVNVGEKVYNGIIAHGQTRLMNGPSPGANVVQVVGAGHRVEIVGRHDVWVKILWQGQTVFMKENNLLPLRF